MFNIFGKPKPPVMVVFKSIAQGASHLKYDPPVPCQDYADAYECKDPPYGAVAIADGHGSAKHIRCERGSRFAVEVALAAVKEYMERPEGIQKMLQNEIKKDEKNKKLLDDMLQRLKNYIIHKWRECVKEDIENNSLSEQEMEICSKEKLDMSKEEWSVVLYGTTLLFAIWTPLGVLAFQIGDGYCVLIDNNGEPMLLEELFDNVQEGGRTNSLCASDAAEKFRHAWHGGVGLRGITVASDGVTDSFDRSSNSYLAFTKTLLQNFENSPTDEVKEKLDKYLPELSKKGSGDDMSIAGVLMLKGGDR